MLLSDDVYNDVIGENDVTAAVRCRYWTDRLYGVRASAMHGPWLSRLRHPPATTRLLPIPGDSTINRSLI